jgi:hypothetical protein
MLPVELWSGEAYLVSNSVCLFCAERAEQCWQG